MTDVLAIDPRQPDRVVISKAAEILRRGGLVAFPTETVYGLGAHAFDRAAVRRVFEAKGRPAADPLIVHVADVDRVAALVADVPDVVHALAARFWPGSLTLVLWRSAAVPDEVTAGLDTVAVRIPAHPVARALITAADLALAAPSANLFSRPSPTRAEHVRQDLDGRIDLILDGGPTTVGVESTVLDLTAKVPVVLRPGAVTLEMIRSVLPQAQMREVVIDTASTGLASPGLLSKHYSPRAAMTLYDGAAGAAVARLVRDAEDALARGDRVGIIAADDDRLWIKAGPDALQIIRVGTDEDLSAVARNLYAALRSLDAAGVNVIFARTFPADSGLGTAIHDRLRRAAGLIVQVSEG